MKPARSNWPSFKCWEKRRCAMSAGTVPPIPDPGSLRRGRFTYFPVVPGRLEFALEVRRAILRDRPRVVAVELPGSLEAAWLSGIARLPAMSLIFYPADDELAEYVLVEPADPFTEAIRTGIEMR